MAAGFPAVRPTVARATSGLTRIAIVAVSLAALVVRAISAQTTVVRRADIERAGWNRVSEILDGAVGWGRASVDAFTYSASPDHLPAAGESLPSMPEWIVVIDGQRVPTDLFGLHVLELLPISVGQIDSVVFVRGPIMYAGIPVARGVMSIFSRGLHAGINGELTYQHGDESGDPGPYRYTNLSSPNVEKIGPFAHTDLGWRSDHWDVDAGLHIASINVTDTLISSRFPPTTFAGVRQDVLSITPTFRLGLDALGGHQELLASRGEQRGLFFIPSQRGEQSLRTTSTYVGIGGALNVGSEHRIEYEGSSSSLNASELASPLAFSVGHTRRHLGGKISVSHGVGRATLTAGALGDRWTLEAAGAPGSSSSSGGGPFARALVPLGSIVTLDANASLVFDGAHAGALDASLQVSFRIDSLTSLAVRGSRIHAHSNMDGSWIDAYLLGYVPPSRAPTFNAMSAALDRRFGSRVGVTIELRAENVADWSGLGPPTSRVAPSPADLLAHDGAILGAHARIETLGEHVWQGSIEYDHASTFNLDARGFGGELASTPSDDLRAQLSASPVRDFRLSGILNLAGGSRWEAFGSTLGSPGVVPPVRRIDASMEKWMWQRRLRLELLYRNLLNEADRYHPYGAQWNLRWHASASLLF
jgi:hypothetical protein